MKFGPRKEAILRALAGDSTITSRRPSDAALFAAPEVRPFFLVRVDPATLTCSLLAPVVRCASVHRAQPFTLCRGRTGLHTTRHHLRSPHVGTYRVHALFRCVTCC